MIAGNQRGSVLIVVLFVLVTLTLVGATLGSLAVNDQRQAARQQRNNESFYLARSGAEAVATYLLANQELIKDYIGHEDVVELGQGSFTVRVLNGPNNTVLIESTGFVGDYSEKVTLSLIGGESGSYLPIFDMALFTDGGINLESGAKIFGRVGTNTTAPNSVRLDNSNPHLIFGDCYIGVGGVINNVFPSYNRVDGNVSNLDEPRTYPMPEFPDFPTLPTKPNIKTNWDNASPIITEDGYYDTITIDQNYEVRVDVGDKDTIRRIRVRNFNGVQGRLLLEGEGKLQLYVDERFHIKGFFNGGQDWGNPDQAIIFYNSPSDFALYGETQVYASLYAMFDYDTAKVQFTNGANLYGSVFTNAANVLINGGSNKNYVRVFYAPNALFELANSGTVYGAVVANTFQASGGVKIEYHPDVDKVWDAVPEIGFEDNGDNPGNDGYTRGYWSN